MHPSQVDFCQFAGLRRGVSCFVSPVINRQINISTEQSFLPPFPLPHATAPTFPSTPTLSSIPWSCREEQHAWTCPEGLLPTSAAHGSLAMSGRAVSNPNANYCHSPLMKRHGTPIYVCPGGILTHQKLFPKAPGSLGKQEHWRGLCCPPALIFSLPAFLCDQGKSPEVLKGDVPRGTWKGIHAFAWC